MATAPRAALAPSVRPTASPAAEDESGEQRMQQQLAAAIYEHRLQPGTKLPEIELCRIFGVTRGAVRKVFNRLAGEQLLDLIPNRGAFVARPSVEETRDVYELRRILEGGAVRRLAKCGPHHRWIAALRRQVGEEREANRVGNTARYIQLAGKFHTDLVAATGNAALEQALRRVVGRTSLMVALYDVPGTNACSFHEHLEILDAIEDANYAKAERLMEEHLLGLERQLRFGEAASAVDLAQVFGGPAVATPTPGARARRRAVKSRGRRR
jgi:DNA-binding GntR family transcriptional regulator